MSPPKRRANQLIHSVIPAALTSVPKYPKTTII